MMGFLALAGFSRCNQGLRNDEPNQQKRGLVMDKIPASHHNIGNQNPCPFDLIPAKEKATQDNTKAMMPPKTRHHCKTTKDPMESVVA